jgi:glutaconate CoA-transferase subunit A
MAGAMGVPFLPCRSSLGSDILYKWGFSEEMRKADPKLCDHKMLVMDNPFGQWAETTKVALVPAITTDVTIIHVQKADYKGNARIEGLSFADIEQAKSAKHLIITCEELIETDELKLDPDRNSIPFFCVDAVVHVPFGAYPTACFGYYDYDPVYMKNYSIAARNDNDFHDYMKSYVFDVSTHDALIEKVGSESITRIKADRQTGYAKNLDRR